MPTVTVEHHISFDHLGDFTHLENYLREALSQHGASTEIVRSNIRIGADASGEMYVAFGKCIFRIILEKLP